MAAHQIIACSLILIIIGPLGLLFVAHLRHAQMRMEKVFPDNEWAVWAQGYLYIEDFHNKTYVYAQRKIQQLDCSISFAQLDENQTAEAFYEQCARNLRRAAPALRFVSLNGGYIYNPANKTLDDLEMELTLLSDYFTAITQVFRQFRWEVTNFDFNGILVLDKELIASSKFSTLVERTFRTSLHEIPKSDGEARFQLDLNNTTVRVFLSMSAAELFAQAPSGRSKFYLPRMRIGIPPGGRH